MQEMMNVHVAKTNFSKLLARVAKGEEIVIAKGGTPVARLVPYVATAPARPLGVFAGKLWMSDDALYSVPILCVVVAMVLWMGSRTAVRDYDRVRERPADVTAR